MISERRLLKAHSFSVCKKSGRNKKVESKEKRKRGRGAQFDLDTSGRGRANVQILSSCREFKLLVEVPGSEKAGEAAIDGLNFVIQRCPEKPVSQKRSR